MRHHTPSEKEMEARIAAAEASQIYYLVALCADYETDIHMWEVEHYERSEQYWRNEVRGLNAEIIRRYPHRKAQTEEK